MGIFDRLSKPKTAKTPNQTRKPRAHKASAVALVPTNPSSEAQFSFSPRSVLTDKLLLFRPHVSEKAHDLSQNGKYVFIVAPSATKREIRSAVERQFNVHVTHVTVTLKHTRAKRYKTSSSPIRTVKKAVVTLKSGEKIDVFTS